MVTDYEKMFCRAYTGKESSFDVFKRWAESRGVNRFITSHPVWQQVTRKGISSFRKIYGNPYRDQYPSLIWDHTSLWGTVSGEKIIVSQPYAYLPGDMESCFAPPNIRYVPGESEESSQKEIDKFVSWANARGLEIKMFGTKHSWYYPGSTVLIEIREMLQSRGAGNE